MAVIALLAAACTSTESAARGSDDEAVESADSTADNNADNGSGDDGLATQAPDGSYTPPNPDLTRLELDDNTRMGVLDNGLTYFVRSNNSPGGSVSLRLAVNAGGLHEDPIGTGVAHFLEHMMFNGTERFPGGSLDATLRSIGAEIGPDFNAFTSDNATVYQLQVADQGNNVETAFDVLFEWATSALIEPDAVADEAPVVREELRLRDESGDGIIGVAFDDAYYLETPYDGTNVSGTAESVNAITPEDLREFYDTWYRPDNIAIIAVGDRSLDDLEDDIVDRFADMTARGEIVPQPTVGEFGLRTEPLVDVVIEPSFGDSFISVDIPVRSWDTGTVGGNELFLTEIVLSIAINNRLNEGVDTGRLDLRRAGGGWFPRNNDLAYIGFNVDADDLVSGTEVLMTELQGTLQNPFTSNEIDRAIDAVKAGQEQRLAEVESTQDSDFADELVFAFLDGGDISNVEDSVDRNLDFLDGLSADEANNHWGWMLTSSAPIVLIVGPDAERVGDPADHLAAVNAASEAIVDALDDDIAEIDILVDAPEPVREIESNDLDSGDIELVFENGHSVIFAETSISEGQVTLVSESPGGRAALPESDGPLASAAASAVSSSGVADWSPTQLRRYLADLDATVTPVVSDFTEGFSGSSSTDDVETMFQLLHLAVTEPRIDDVPFAQQIEATRDFVEQIGLDSETAAQVAATNARTGGGSFTAAPTEDQLDAFTTTEAQRIYDDRFSSLDEHVIAVVGDLDEDDLVDLARTWIGTLPPADGTDDPGGYPTVGNVTERLSVGSGTSGGSFFLIATSNGASTVENLMLADVTSRILDDRIFTVIREELGASYGGFSFSRFVEPGNDVDLIVSINGDPSRIDEIAETVAGELSSVAGGNIFEADFDEAIAVIDAELGFINNGFIVQSMFDEVSNNDGPLLNRANQRRALEAITPADVAEFVNNIITSGQRIDVRNVPAG